MDILQFINLRIEGNVGFFQFLAVINKAAINMSAGFFVDVKFSNHLSKYLGTRFLDCLLGHASLCKKLTKCRPKRLHGFVCTAVEMTAPLAPCLSAFAVLRV